MYDAEPEHEYGSPPALSPARLLDVACARAAGMSWEAAASRLNLPLTPDELRRACPADDRYDQLHEKADREADAELRASLRASLRDPDPAARGRAQERLGLHLRARERNATRLRVENVRAAERAAEAPLTDEERREEHGRRMRRYAGCEQLYGEEHPDRPHWDQAARFDRTPEEYGRFIAEARHLGAKNEQLDAIDVTRRGRVVWLWGGRHPIGGHPPDGTDRPVYLRADHTCAARMQQVFYWAVPNPPPEPEQESGVGSQQSDRKAQAAPDAPPVAPKPPARGRRFRRFITSVPLFPSPHLGTSPGRLSA